VTFDLTRLASRIDDLAGGAASGSSAGAFSELANAFDAIDAYDLSGRIKEAKTTWLLAQPDRSFQGSLPAPSPPAEYSVVASDGSFILPDRHSPARFYIINIGKVVLRYGRDPHAEITADPEIYFREHELYVPNEVKRIPVSGTLLGFKRAADELTAVAEVAGAQTGPTIGLQDGTLILWGLETFPQPVVNWILDAYLGALDALEERDIPIASYISSPASSDVMNSIRVSVCDYPLNGRPVDCRDCHRRAVNDGHIPACDFIPDVSDRVLFEQIAALHPGERSQVFASRSEILKRYSPQHHIHFFYLHSGTEIARVEVPHWVARDETKLDLIHAAIYDQCVNGRGYPTALQEAHEVAAIRPHERRAVEALVEEALARRGLVYRRSAKDESKRGRFV
jgi:HAMP domain-containing protein